MNAAFALTLCLTVAACGPNKETEQSTPLTKNLSVVASEMRFSPAAMRVLQGGSVTFINTGAVVHDFVVEGHETLRIVAQPGERSYGVLELPAGRYTVYCSIPGHRDAGMEGVLQVSENS